MGVERAGDGNDGCPQGEGIHCNRVRAQRHGIDEELTGGEGRGERGKEQRENTTGTELEIKKY